MITPQDRNNPSWAVWPTVVTRTAWRPFSVPAVLVVPRRRDIDGNHIAGSEVWGVSVIIEGAPKEALVAGHNHGGIRFPDRDLYTRSITDDELVNFKIDVTSCSFFRNGEPIDYVDAVTGDAMRYTTVNNNTADIVWYADADYYDLSSVALETEHLLPRRYNVVFTCNFHNRLSDDGTLLRCISATTGTAVMKFGMNHPGELMTEFYRNTPAPNFIDRSQAIDSTIAFYRPLTDMLQDVYDEQVFIQQSNWLSKVPYEAIPYLAQLLGWDVPYFPRSSDSLRRTMLRKIRELQTLRGSRRAMRELMNIFGFTILINNLYYSTDGERLIGPGESLPPKYADQEIAFTEVYQVEPAVSEYQTDGYGQLLINLLYRPQRLSGNDPFQAPEDSAALTIHAYLVATGSDADRALAEQVALMSADPGGYGKNARCTTSTTGFISIGQIDAALAGKELNGYSKLLLSSGISIDQALAGLEPPIRVVGPPLVGGAQFNADNNQLSITFDHYITFQADRTRLYVIAAYKRQEIDVPAALHDLESNRFDIQILTKANEQAQPDVLDFLLDFIHKIKAFHSLLNVVRYQLQLDEGYLATDLCVGGDVAQRSDTAFGKLQVPPAFIPHTPTSECQAATPSDLGYRTADLTYRSRLLQAVQEEFAAWKALDGRSDEPNDLLAIIPNQAAGNTCQYTGYGQSRTTHGLQQTSSTELQPRANSNDQSQSTQSNLNLPPRTPGNGSTNSDSSVVGSVSLEYDRDRETLCADSAVDHCYTGRLKDSEAIGLHLVCDETVAIRICVVGMGTGTYWTYPATSKQVVVGVSDQDSRSRSRRAIYSGKPYAHYGDDLLGDSPAWSGLAVKSVPPSWLGRLMRSYGKPADETIHYSNRPYVIDVEQTHHLALQRPSLSIDIPFMHFPGCRFATLDKLKHSFTHPTHRAAPWDDQYSKPCNGHPTWLNASIDENGMLVYDDVPFTVAGNNLDADISTLGEHTPPSWLDADKVIHAISSSSVGGHPAVELEGIDNCTSDMITVDQPLFKSASPEGTGSYLDFCDGYKSQYGVFHYTGSLHDSDQLALLEAMQVPGIEFGSSGHTASVSLLFTMGSGILVRNGIRMDCGCLLAGSSADVSCVRDLFNDDGDAVWDVDKLSADVRMVPADTLGVSSYLMDGSIPSLLEVKRDLSDSPTVDVAV